MKREVSLRKNGTRRVKIVFDQKTKTDQSMKNACDINCMIDTYRRTGMLPHVKEKTPVYMDTSELPNFMDAFDIVNHAKQLFNELPSHIRKQMNNDPRLLEDFVKDPENKAVCIKHGLLEEVKKPEIKPILADSDIERLADALEKKKDSDK